MYEVYMKRTYSTILAALLIISFTLTLAACGSVTDEKEWNAAMDFLKNSDTVTINYERNDYTNLHIKEEITNRTVSYNGVNGVLYADHVVKNFNVSVLGKTKQHQTYAVVDGTDIKYYTKDIVDSSFKNWDATLITCDSKYDALLKLKELFWSYLTDFGVDKLNFNEYTLKINKFEKSGEVKQNSTVQQVTFSDGKLSKIYFESKPKKGSQSIDYAKMTISVLYSAEPTTPTGLENAIWKY